MMSKYKHTTIFSKAIFLSMNLLLWMNVMHDFIWKSRGKNPQRERDGFIKYVGVGKGLLDKVQSTFNEKNIATQRRDVL